MKTLLSESWNSFNLDVAKKYLKTFGKGSNSSKEILSRVIQRESKSSRPSLLELGCGNGQLLEFLMQQNVKCSYTGVDFSTVLLKAARTTFAKIRGVEFVQDDISELKKINGQFDFAIFSHVIEMLESPELCLLKAKQFAPKILIRFFEPPEFDFDTVELLGMNVGKNDKVPYLRRKMSSSYYHLILNNVGCKTVDIYKSADKDQVHLLHF